MLCHILFITAQAESEVCSLYNYFNLSAVSHIFGIWVWTREKTCKLVHRSRPLLNFPSLCSVSLRMHSSSGPLQKLIVSSAVFLTFLCLLCGRSFHVGFTFTKWEMDHEFFSCALANWLAGLHKLCIQLMWNLVPQHAHCSDWLSNISWMWCWL